MRTRCGVFLAFFWGWVAGAGGEPAARFALGDWAWVEPAAWPKADEAVLLWDEKAGELTVRGEGEGRSVWVSVPGRFRLTPESALDVVIGEVKGECILQAEWFDAEGKFLAATDLAASGGRLVLRQEGLAARVPGGLAAEQFGLKLWMAGERPSAVISRIRLSNPVAFQKEGAVLAHAYDAKSGVAPDDGMDVETGGAGWRARLRPETSASAFLLKPKIPYEAGKGAVLADVTAIRRGGLTIQMLCWDGAGTYLTAVDLLKDITEPGAYEVGLDLVEEQVPSATREVNFKVWLSGDRAEAKVAGLYYGESR